MDTSFVTVPASIGRSRCEIRGRSNANPVRTNQDQIRTLNGASRRELLGFACVPPFLRWAGSKRKTLPKLLRFWKPSYKRYVEPFAGSACLFFYVGPNKALLGDVNRSLIETMIAVRDEAKAVIRLLKHERRSKSRYYAVRKMRPEQMTPTQRAARFIYLNRYCFNGLYRTNLKGDFNVPFGREGNGLLPSASHLIFCSKLLKKAKLTTSDFRDVLKQTVKGDFVYLDPPYVTDSRRVFSEYHSTILKDKDVKELRKLLLQMRKRGVDFVLNYTACREARYLARGFYVERTMVRRNIAGSVQQRIQRQELLISSSPPHHVDSLGRGHGKGRAG